MCTQRKGVTDEASVMRQFTPPVELFHGDAHKDSVLLKQHAVGAIEVEIKI